MEQFLAQWPLSAKRLRPSRKPKLADPSIASPLLRLPAELRNYIYEFALIEQYTISIVENTIEPALCRASAQPGLARTCRQLRREVLPIFYGRNTFEVYVWFVPKKKDRHATVNGYQLLRIWLAAIGAHNRKLLESVIVCRAGTAAYEEILEVCETVVGATLWEGPNLKWEGEVTEDETCAANSLHNAGMKHFRIRIVEGEVSELSGMSWMCPRT